MSPRRSGPVEIVDHDPGWAVFFADREDLAPVIERLATRDAYAEARTELIDKALAIR